MAEIFLTASVEVLLEKLILPEAATLMKKLFGGGKKYRKMMEEWKIELSNIKALLADAERQQCSSEEVKKWLEELQDVAFDMEDLLADFQIQIQDRQISMANASGFLGSLKNKAKKHLKIKLKNPDKMDGITERLQSIYSRREAVGLSVLSNMQHHIPPTEALRMQRETASIPSKGTVFGRDKEKQWIVNELLKDNEKDENYVVIPIVGNGGIGKTTLAQSIYNDEKLCGFDLKAWVCVSDVFDVTRITTTIYKAVERETVVDFGTLDEAQTKLKKVLMGKKFLIVLDDIWNVEYSEWEKLQTPFQYATKGSRVIMTTRNNDIARMMKNRSDNNITSLKSLSDNDIWCVFQQHANDDLNLAELRDDIIKKCKGLPLAAKVLGGILKQKVNIKQCRMVLENDSWSNEEKGILPVLRLSYHYLPSHLKRVFAYCSVLPKDYKFSEMEIIILWMAQGFLPENQEGHMEDLGHYYFNDLKSRSLFEQSLDDGDLSKKIKSFDDEERFIMHDLTHDLALWAAGGICYEDNKTQADKRQRVRHVYFTKCDDSTLESQLPMASQLRTFLCSNFKYVENLNIIKEFSYVRTLCLRSSSNVVPECIGELRHLRSLSLKFDKITELSISIEKLLNLQTLCLKGCYRLVKIPNISSLGKLRHLEISGTSLKEMPWRFEKLTNLRSLDRFVLGHGRGDRLMELKQFNYLQGKLTICGLENVTMSEYAREAQLHEKCRLDKLVLKWGNKREEVDDVTKKEVVEQLKPHDSIKGCMLTGFIGLALPSWLGDPCFKSMVNVSLIDCKKCERLPPLGQLPRLENLSIKGMENRSMCTATPFPTLKKLHLKNMESLKRWVHVDKDRAFPCLELLKISDCHSLKGDIPPHLPFLKNLQIFGCGQRPVSVQLQSLPLLVELKAEHCEIVLEGNRPCEFPHLTLLIITKNPSLTPIPNGLLLPALETLEIRACYNMKSLPSEMPNYTSLETLEVCKSPKIKYFPEGGLPTNLKHLTLVMLNINEMPLLPSSLFELYMEDIPNLKSISCSSLPKLTKLHISKLNINEMPLLPSSLSKLVMKDIPNLKSISYSSLPKLTELQIFKLNINEMSLLPSSLSVLYMKDIPNLKSISYSSLPKLTELVILELNINEMPLLPSSLSILYIRDIPNLKSISYSSLPKLTELHISKLNINEVPLLPSSLSLLYMTDIPNLKSISYSSLPKLTELHISKLNINEMPLLPSSLSKLYMRDIPNWGIQTSALHRLRQLKEFYLEDVNTEEDLSLPSCLSDIDIRCNQNVKNLSVVDNDGTTTTSLIDLEIQDCPNLEFVAGNFTSLTRLILDGCPNLKGVETREEVGGIIDKPMPIPIREWGLHLLTSLRYLKLEEIGGSCADAVSCIQGPDDLQLPSSLEELSIGGFQNLKSIRCSTLPNLKILNMSRCPQLELESFAESALPPWLRIVWILGCDLIKQRLVRDRHGRIRMDGDRWSVR